MVRIPTHRSPTHPGEMLLEEFFKPMKMSQQQLADAIAVPPQWIDAIVIERRSVTSSIVLRLEKFFGMPLTSGSTYRFVGTCTTLNKQKLQTWKE